LCFVFREYRESEKKVTKVTFTYFYSLDSALLVGFLN